MMNRKKASTLNAGSAIILNIITIFIGFIAQRIFINTLGTEVMGLNNLFTNIVSVLTMADMGLGSAVLYYLYKPIAQNDTEKVASIIFFYRRACYAISAIIIALGILLLPFLNNIVGSDRPNNNIYIVFILFIISSVLSYLMTYKRALLQASQKNYIISTVHVGYVLVLNGIQIALLLETHNYYIYLGALIIMKFLENIAVNYITTVRYSHIVNTKPQPLAKSTKNGIIKIMKGTVFHNSAGYIANSKDSIVISNMFGLAQLGVFANYQLIIVAVSTLVSQIFYSITASIGNLLVEGNKDKSYKVVKRVCFINLWVAFIASIIFFSFVNEFVVLWLGSGYVVDYYTLVSLTIMLYLQSTRHSILSILLAAGVTYENRHIPVIEVAINVICSVVFAYLWGLPGVFLGTSASMIFLHLVGYPKYCFELILGRKRREYRISFLVDFILFLGSMLFIKVISNYTLFNSGIVSGIIVSIVGVIFSTILLSIRYRKSEEYRYFVAIVMGLIKRKLLNRA